MILPFSRAVRRLACLFVAERALRAGAPERALVSLTDPAVSRSGRATRLRERALRDLGVKALRRAAAGRDRSAGRLLALLATEDWSQAQTCRERLHWIAEASAGQGQGMGRALHELQRSSSLAPRPGQPSPAVPSGGSALPSSRASSSQASSSGPASAPRVGAPEPAAPVESVPESSDPAELSMSALLRMSVDDGGEWLWVDGQAGAANGVVLGHAHGGQADLPFLADVGIRHAELSTRESLREGLAWYVTPIDGEDVRVDGRPLEGPERLRDGARLDFGENLAMRVRFPDRLSASGVLDFLRGAECLGATHVLLAAPGPGGRVSIGPNLQDHVLVASEEVVRIVRTPGGLEARVEETTPGAAPSPPGAAARHLDPARPGGDAVALVRREAGGPRLEVRWSIAPTDPARGSGGAG